MKIITFIAVPAVLILFSCQARKKEAPAILEGKKIDVSSIYKKRGADLVEALYEEVVSNSNELKKLEQEIKAMKVTWPDSLEAFRTFHEKNYQYYETAEKKATAITDSAVRKSVLDLLRKSRQHYRDSISNFTSVDTLLQQRAAVIDNLHSLLKIMSTLPVIEEFQQSNRPDTFAAATLTRRMDDLIIKLDSLTRQLKPQPTVVPAEKK